MINSTDSVYTISAYYRIERFKDKEWIEMPRKYGFIEDIGYAIKPNGGKRIFTINLQNVEPTYQKGVYHVWNIVSDRLFSIRLFFERYF